MVVGFLIRRHAPFKTDRVKEEERKKEGMAFLTSTVNDTDVFTDWMYFFTIGEDIGVSLQMAQLLSCIVGTLSWLIIASDGRVMDWLRRGAMFGVLIILKLLFGVRIMCAKLRHWNRYYFYQLDDYYFYYKNSIQSIKDSFAKGFNFPTGALILLGILLEDLPQVIVTFIIEDLGEEDGFSLSSTAQLNLLLAFFDIGHKLAEAWDSRKDMVRAADALLHVIREHSYHVTSLVFISGSRFVSGGWEDGMKLMEIETDASTGKVTHKVLRSFDVGDVDEMVKLDESKIFVRFYDNEDNGLCKIFNIETGDSLDFLDHPASVTSVAVSPSGGCILTGCKDKKVRKWNAVPPHTLMEWKCTLSLAEEDSKEDDSEEEHCNSEVGIDIKVGFLDDNLFVKGSLKLFIMKVHDGSVFRSFETKFEFESRVKTITTMHPNSFVTVHWNGSIKHWDKISENCVHTFEGHEDRVTSIVKVNDLHFISGSADKTAKLWNIQSKNCIHTFSGHTTTVNTVMLMPTGNTVLTGSADKSIKVWSLNEFISDVGSGKDAISHEENAEEGTNTDLERGTTETRAGVSNTGDVEIYEGIKMAK